MVKRSVSYSIALICIYTDLCGNCNSFENCQYWYGLSPFYILLLLLFSVFFILAILNIVPLNPNKSLDLFSLFVDFPVYIVKSMDFLNICSIVNQIIYTDCVFPRFRGQRWSVLFGYFICICFYLYICFILYNCQFGIQICIWLKRHQFII